MDKSQKAVCRVLYVEDTPEDQRMLHEAIALAEVAVEVVSASTADAAIQWLGSNSDFTVVLLDWNLPAVTGTEFLAEARKLRPDLPVLILTGEPGTVDIAGARRFGVEKIACKPLNLDDWERLAVILSGFCQESKAASF